MAASVEGKLPNLDSLKKLVRDDLRRHCSIALQKHGAKDLFIDPTLMKPIDRIANVKFLQDHGVEKIYKIDSSKPVQGNRERFYITRPKVISIKYIVEQMKAEKSAGQVRHYTIVMVPRSLYICEKILEQNGVFGWVTIETLSFNLLPIDKDILTIELDFFYSSYFLHHDETWLHTAASALVALQQEFGKIPNFYAIGQAAKSAWQLSQTLLDCGPDITGVPKQIGHVILMDRDVDLVSPLCSQVTYEGLLDDIFGIQCGVVQFDKSVTGSDNVMKIPLNSDDWLFQEVRNKHFSTVFKQLSAKAKELQKSYDKKDEMSVAQMKEFVAKDLKSLKATHKSLTIHISACEEITKRKTASGELEDQLATEHGLLEGHSMTENTKYIEECIYQQQRPATILRLMCLLSLVKDGLSPETYESLKTAFLQSHGYQHVVTFHNLLKLGLFTKRANPSQTTVKLPGGSSSSLKIATGKLNLPRKSSFQILSKNLHLIPKSGVEIDLRNPTDMSYVFSGAYTPLSCRLVELIIEKRGFTGIEDSIKLITNSFGQSVKAQSARGGKPGGIQSRDPADQTVVVFFLGGVTYSEIAALRFLGRKYGNRFLILSTNIITGDRFISQTLP